MIKKISVLVLLALSISTYSQKVNFPEWGDISEYEKKLVVYEKDSSAHAVVLREMGYAFVKESGGYEIIKEYYVKIKILDKEGFKHTTVEIPTYKKENVFRIKASTINFNNGKKITSLDKSNIFETKVSENWNQTSFTLPNIKVGSIIEYSYKISTPYHHTFADGWLFQNDIPKINSTYFAKIPGFWQYHISTVSLLDTEPRQYRLIKNCMNAGHSTASCIFLEYSIDNVPAFIEEDFSTSKYNYLKQIKFELKTFTDSDINTSKITTTWKDVDKEIFKDYPLGKKYGKTKFFENKIPKEILNETNELIKAKKIYSFIQNHYNWNGNYYLYKDFNFKKAFENGVGNMVEINMSLINALITAGYKTDFVLLSTRKNGFPRKLHPVISDFNYMIAHIKIKGKDYFLDAIDKNMPFGMLPFYCTNGEFRVFEKDKNSYWFNFKPSDNNVTNVYAIADISKNTEIKIKTRVVYMGYSALNKRKNIQDISVEKYIDKLDNENEELDIVNHTIENLDKRDQPLVEVFEFKSNPNFINNNSIYLKPFLIKNFKTNPFTLNKRLYPVDLGYKRKFKYNLVFNIPKGYRIESVPKNRKISLPNNGGKLIYLLNNKNNKITIHFSFTLDKTIYESHEYSFLKKYMSQLIIAQNEMIILTKE